MSIYNHKEFLRKDPLGEMHFVLCKLRQECMDWYECDNHERRNNW